MWYINIIYKLTDNLKRRHAMSKKMIGYHATQRRLNHDSHIVDQIDWKNSQIEMAKGKVGKRFNNAYFNKGRIITVSSLPDSKRTTLPKFQTNNLESRQFGSSVTRVRDRRRKDN